MGRARYDWLIVGAGFTGAVVAERIASELDQRVLLIDRRDHIGGNAYDATDEHGVLVHQYGPHIFHTNSQKVWDYLSRFTEWRPYFHHVLGVIDGHLAPIPFNLNSLYQLFPPRLAGRLEEALVEGFGFGTKVPILKLRESANPELSLLAEYIYENVFAHYTAKQWGLTPEELSASVTGRVPVYVSRDDRYFQDVYQAMPADGYTKMFERIVAHPNIDVATGVDYEDGAAEARDARVVYTGAIDEYFGYTLGTLPYRSLRFEFTREAEATHQPVGTVNYPNNFDFTRTTELNHLSGQLALPQATFVTEYPQAHLPGVNDPYYPVPRDQNRELYERYAALADEVRGQVFFAGRLADYKYYNMDQAVGRAMSLFEREIAPLVGGIEAPARPTARVRGAAATSRSASAPSRANSGTPT